jgi:microcystin-dependent protein
MGQPYIGEIRMFGGNFAPAGWMFCEGQLLPISGNETLFNLIRTTYGGDGQNTFGLPDLKGRIPIHQGQGSGLSNRSLAEQGGHEKEALTINQLPTHTHSVRAQSKRGNTNNPANAVWASSTLNQYAADVSTTKMQAGSISTTGLGQPHNNMMPFLAVNFIISLYGIYPLQS